MNNYLFAIICLLAFPLFADASERRIPEAGVYGHVLDKNTGDHVPFLLVSLKGTTVATSTGDTGHYHLEHLPSGRV